MPLPVWTAVPAGSKITAEILGRPDELLQWLDEDRPITWLTFAGTQSLTNNIYTAVGFTGEPIDRASMHSTTSNTSRINIGLSLGRYLCFGIVAYNGNATGTRNASLRKNGVEVTGASTIAPAGTTGFCSVQVVGLVTATDPADYVELYGMQNSGGSLGLAVSGGFTSSFGVVRIGS